MIIPGQPICQFSGETPPKYRYTLWREVNPEAKGIVAFICLNPSTADETQDDPTVRRCMRFTKDWGYRWFCMLNVFAFRATDPKDMKAVDDPKGPENLAYIQEIVRMADVIVAAWGVHGNWRDGDKLVQAAMTGYMGSSYESGQPDIQMKCLGKTKHGHPKHPLYLKADSKLIDYP